MNQKVVNRWPVEMDHGLLNPKANPSTYLMPDYAMSGVSNASFTCIVTHLSLVNAPKPSISGPNGIAPYLRIGHF